MADDSDNVINLEVPRLGKPDNARTLSRKWGKEVMSANYTVIPCALLRGQARLRIGPSALAVLVHLIDHWWRPEAMPWPSKKSIAERLSVSTKTVQRAIVELEKAGLLTRKNRYRKTGGRTSNEYDLSPLVDRLKPVALDMARAAAEAKAGKRAAERPGLKERAPSASA